LLEAVKELRIKAVRAAETLEIVFFGKYDTYFIMNELLEKYEDLRDLVAYGGFRTAKEIAGEILSADALLFLENDGSDDGVLTGKIFEYLYARKPILCIGVDQGSYVGEFLSRTGLCWLCGNDIEKVKDFLLKLIKDEITLAPNDSYITGFSRQKQTEKLSALISQLLA
jgi:glycosyltransferase involved in cell wall biosynthesis